MKRVMVAAVAAALVLTMAVPGVATAKASKTAAVARPKGKPTFVSHPYTKKDRLQVGVAFNVWGYVNTWRAVPLTMDSTLTIQVQKWKGGRSWETSAGLATTAAITANGNFRRKTNYSAVMNIGVAGRYRLLSLLVWRDAQGIQRTNRSSWKYIQVK